MKTIRIGTTTISNMNREINRANWCLFADITVKSGSKVFSPSWEIVMGYKEGRISWKEYEEKYREMMRKSYRQNEYAWRNFIEDAAMWNKPVYLACYCAKGENCHRHLLKQYLKKVAESMGYNVEIIEEV